MRRTGYSDERPRANRHNGTRRKPSGRFNVGTAFVLSALACLNGPSALAQWSGSATGSLGMGMGSIALSQSILSGTRRLGGAARPANSASGGARLTGNSEPSVDAALHKFGSTLAAGRANTALLNSVTPAQIGAAMSYKADPQISATIREDMIKLATRSNPAGRPALEKAYANDAVLRTFEGFVTARGYSRYNVADVMAVALWGFWEIANGVTLTAPQIQGVHQQVRAAWLGSPEARAMTNTTRQHVAETLIYYVVDAAVQARSSDPAALAAERQVLSGLISALTGLELARLEVTADSGFRQKRAAVALDNGSSATAVQSFGQDAAFVNTAPRQPLQNVPSGTGNGQQQANALSGSAASGDKADLARRKLASALTVGVNTAILNGMTPAQIDAALGYQRDPQLSAKLRAKFIDSMAAVNVVSREALEKAFANDVVQQEFERLVAAHGYSSLNVADAIAAELWTSWQRFHGVSLTDAQIRGIHQQIRATVLRIPELQLPNAGRQMLAESMAYAVVLREMRQGNGDLQSAQLRRDTAELIGVDLSELEVTDDSGFRQKRAAVALGNSSGAAAVQTPVEAPVRPSSAAAPSAPARPAAAPSAQSFQPPPELAECVNRDSKDVPRWLDACARAIDTNPGNKDVLQLAYLTRASAYTKLRQFDRVIGDSDEVLRLAPQGPISSIAYGLRGVALMQRHEYDRALADFDKAITSQPSLALAEAYAGRGNVYLRIANYQRARADLDKAISLKPGFSMAYAIRAQYRLEQNDNAGALADANEGLRLDPQNADCYAMRAEYYVRVGKFTEAQADADRALGISPESAGAHAIRGRIALAQDRIEVALGELTEAIDLESQEPDAVANRGVAYERYGRADRAIADYRRALQLMPSSRMGREAQENARQRIVALANAPASTATAAVSVPAAPPGRRIALVIGMSAYANVGPLRNPASDARAVADAFRRVGFAEVIEREDLTRTKLEETLKDFGDKAADADWAVIYYAGHGIEMNGVNYLIPVDAKLARAEHVEDEAVTLARVLSKAEAARKLRMVILDACRNNPFRMASAEGRSRAIGRGLSPVEPARGVLVAYAARDGTTADDGDDGHSPFTQALLANLETPGVDIRIMFSKVRDQVLARTKNVQEPFTYGSLPGQEFYFKLAAR